MDALTELVDRYDKRTAAGILARAVLEAQTGQEYRDSIVENERALRTALIVQARAKLGFKQDDESPEVIDKIGSYLESESERLANEPRVASAFERLIARGDLPSDLYQIRIIPNIAWFFGKEYLREKALIERTIRSPNSEQHFGAGDDTQGPRLVSLFARHFKTPFTARDFTMLVAGQRGRGQALDVHMAWRLYPSRVDFADAADLVELLRRFADRYGADIKLDGQRGRFFLTTSEYVPDSVKVDVSNPKRLTAVTRFVQRNPKTGKSEAALVMAIDLDLYRATIDHWDCKEIF
jgi:hypothetical protein